MIDRHDMVISAGACLVLVGIALWSIPAALIFAGVFIGGMAYLDGRTP